MQQIDIFFAISSCLLLLFVALFFLYKYFKQTKRNATVSIKIYCLRAQNYRFSPPLFTYFEFFMF